MCRNCHDCACTIAHHYIICNVDRNLLTVDRVDTFQSLNTYTCFVFDELCSLELSFLCTFVTICGDLVHICYFVFVLVDDRMFRSDYHESNTEQSIRSGCINFKFFIDAVNIKVNECTL